MIDHTVLPKDWLKFLGGEFEKDYMMNLDQFLSSEVAIGKEIYPKSDDIFSAFNLTPLKKVKVVVFGQDPYHGEGQAHGLSFSVKPGIKIPPSLANMYKEMKSDLGVEIPTHGCLKSWARQGVLMLNSVLTVEASQAASHQKKGWELFTDKVVQVLNEEKEKLVFILWGAHAEKKGKAIDSKKHFILKAPHPSPLFFWMQAFFSNK